MAALEHASMRADLEAQLPTSMQAGVTVTTPCTVTNHGDAALASGGQYPVYVCYRWYDAAGDVTEVGRSIHSALPGVLHPGASVSAHVRIAAPRAPGTYTLRVTLLQSEIAWFDDVDPASGVAATVSVAAGASEPDLAAAAMGSAR